LNAAQKLPSGAVLAPHTPPDWRWWICIHKNTQLPLTPHDIYKKTILK